MNESRFKRWLKTRYHLELSTYNDVLDKQNALCAQCFRPQSMFDAHFTVQWDVIRRTIRRLVCSDCDGLCCYR